MTEYCFTKPQALSLKLLLHSSNLLTVAPMEVKLGAHVYYIVSMMTTTTNSLRHFSLKLHLHSSNSLIVARMKLDAHVYCIVSVTTTATNSLRHLSSLFFKITSSLLKLANVTMHGDELGTDACNAISMTTSCSHDSHILFEQQQIASGINFFTPQTCQRQHTWTAHDTIPIIVA